jgi:hypothetical protein
MSLSSRHPLSIALGMRVAAGAIGLRIAAIVHHGSANSPSIPDFHVAFVLISVVALISVAEFLKLDVDAGAVVSGHQRSLNRG